MDDATLQNRLRRIEQRQSLVIALLVVPYLVGVGELVGYWITAVVVASLAAVAFGLVVISRRRRRDAAGE
jgi:hypothetical protein